MAIIWTACFDPKTPQEATTAFWEAVIEENTRGVVRYSTLQDETQYDGFDREWQGVEPILGRVVIDGHEASVVVSFGKPGDAKTECRRVTTYLVEHEGVWTVDYERTSKGMQGGFFSAIMGELDKFGRQLSEHFNASSDDLHREMETMSRELKALSDTLDQKAAESIERYGDVLRESIDKLAASARDALEEEESQLSDEEKQLLDDVATELENDSDDLSDPNVDTITQSSANAAKAQIRLLSINEEALERYKRQWLQWQKTFKENAQQFLEELHTALESSSEDKK